MFIFLLIIILNLGHRMGIMTGKFFI